MTTLPQGDLPRDPGILGTASQYNQVNVGVYAAVIQCDVIHRGDPVRFAMWRVDASLERRAAISRRRLTMSEQGQPGLYDRLGGVYSIATVVDDFIDRIMVDQRLNVNPHVDEAHHRVPPAGFKYLVTEMVCEAAGGPQRHSGRSMDDSHRSLMITPDEWQAFLDDFQQSLDKFAVSRREQEELMALVESSRAAIVVPPA